MEQKYYYTDEWNTQIVIALLKTYGIFRFGRKEGYSR